MNDKLIESLDATKDLCDFAYRSGFHELGYDPVEVIRKSCDELKKTIGIVTTQRDIYYRMLVEAGVLKNE